MITNLHSMIFFFSRFQSNTPQPFPSFNNAKVLIPPLLISTLTAGKSQKYWNSTGIFSNFVSVAETGNVRFFLGVDLDLGLGETRGTPVGKTDGETRVSVSFVVIQSG
ncbi:hypothetical protein E6O75_ATG00739 [Venturia nashicola]|uniref:Uncharacterized protein n=1 Tax=Venturia nashicola TaxID=86259 RepID=A0A4Z1PXR8_9PEZI|nr:hypothetical protein E6O75_ATG00739 [Venturia nashicola]